MKFSKRTPNQRGILVAKLSARLLGAEPSLPHAEALRLAEAQVSLIDEIVDEVEDETQTPQS